MKSFTCLVTQTRLCIAVPILMVREIKLLKLVTLGVLEMKLLGGTVATPLMGPVGTMKKLELTAMVPVPAILFGSSMAPHTVEGCSTAPTSSGGQ